MMPLSLKQQLRPLAQLDYGQFRLPCQEGEKILTMEE